MAFFVPLLLLGGSAAGGYFFAKSGVPTEVLVTDGQKKLAWIYNNFVSDPTYKHDCFVLDLDHYCLYNLTRNEMYMAYNHAAIGNDIQAGKVITDIKGNPARGDKGLAIEPLYALGALISPRRKVADYIDGKLNLDQGIYVRSNGEDTQIKVTAAEYLERVQNLRARHLEVMNKERDAAAVIIEKHKAEFEALQETEKARFSNVVSNMTADDKKTFALAMQSFGVRAPACNAAELYGLYKVIDKNEVSPEMFVDFLHGTNPFGFKLSTIGNFLEKNGVCEYPDFEKLMDKTSAERSESVEKIRTKTDEAAALALKKSKEDGIWGWLMGNPISALAGLIGGFLSLFGFSKIFDKGSRTGGLVQTLVGGALVYGAFSGGLQKLMDEAKAEKSAAISK